MDTLENAWTAIADRGQLLTWGDRILSAWYQPVLPLIRQPDPEIP